MIKRDTTTAAIRLRQKLCIFDGKLYTIWLVPNKFNDLWFREDSHRVEKEVFGEGYAVRSKRTANSILVLKDTDGTANPTFNAVLLELINTYFQEGSFTFTKDFQTYFGRQDVSQCTSSFVYHHISLLLLSLTFIVKENPKLIKTNIISASVSMNMLPYPPIFLEFSSFSLVLLQAHQLLRIK